MAFSSFEELVNSSAKDPRKTMGLVKKAQDARRPVVARPNPAQQSMGQGQQGAVQRRLRAIQTTAEKERDIISEERKSGYGS